MNDAASDQDRADMGRVARGDEQAFDALMGRHAGRLHAYLVRLLQNEADAEDLAQETFVRVFQNRHRFDQRRPFDTWLYTIATNLIRDRFRWRTRHPESPLDDVPLETGSATGAGTEGQRSAPLHPDPRSLPDHELVEAERALAVRRSIARLSPELREVLILAEYEGRSHLEIASILGCSAKAVEMRLYRARQALRQWLAPWLAANS